MRELIENLFIKLNKNDKLIKRINIVSTYLLAYLAVYTLSSSMLYTLFALEPNPYFFTVTILFFIAVFMALFIIISLNNTTKMVGLIGFVIALVYLLYNIFISNSDFIKNVNRYTRWLGDYIMRAMPLNSDYGVYTSVLLVFVITVVVYFICIKYQYPIPIIIFGLSLFIVQSAIMKIHFSKPMFILFIAISIIYYIVCIRKYNIDDNNDYQKKLEGVFAFFSTPLLIGIFLITIIFPSGTKPVIDQKTTANIVLSIENFIKDAISIFEPETQYFSLKQSGFSNNNNSELGGSLASNNSVMLIVKSPTALYLRGRSYDEYSQNKWISNDINLILEDNKIIIPENKELLEFYDWSHPYEYLFYSLINRFSRTDHVSIWYEKSYTNAVFLPTYPDRIRFLNKGELNFKISEYMNYTTDKNNKKGFNYEFYYRKVDFEHEDMQNFLKYGSFLEENAEKYEFLGISEILLRFENDINKNTNAMNEIYLNLPENITQRTRDLTHELTDEYDNNYDKVKAIEQYLATNFEYTKRMPQTTEDMEFVDEFLFELKRGYCTYYATAMTVMCRILGIPTRYVEGYVTPKAADDGFRYVTGNYAHAWVEVYFQNVGFVPFEPTPPFFENFYITEVIYDNAGFMGGEAPNYGDYYEYEDIEEDEEIFDDTDNIVLIIVILVFTLIFVMLFSSVIINILRRKMFFKNIEKLRNRNKIIKLYEFYLKKLKDCGYEYEKFETPYEFAGRISGDIDIQKISESFVKAKYSEIIINDDECKKMVEFYDKFVLKVKNSSKKLTYFIEYYLMGKY